MGRWYCNLGWNRNLLVQLSGGPSSYQLDVYVVARFRFFYSPNARNWTTDEVERWKRLFINLAYNTWSEKWTLLSDMSCASLDVDRLMGQLPTARVRVHAVAVEEPSITLPSQQRLYAINVYRRAPGEARARQHASALETSRATVADAGNGELPTGTSTGEIYEDALELDSPNPLDGNQQVTAMHEFGHLLGLMHPNDMQSGCIVDRSASICYGAPGSPESNGIMGRGQEVRRNDYAIFVHIMQRLLPELPAPGISGYFGATDRLVWGVEGNPLCHAPSGSLAGYATLRGRARPTPLGGPGVSTHRRRGPLRGMA